METLQTALKSLRLGGLAKTLPVRYQEAKANELDYLEFIDNLITDELDRRKENLLNRRIKTAKFPQLKSIDEFNFSFNTTVSKKNIMEMMTSRFVYNAKNTLFIGPPGVGKTHLAIAIGVAAIHNSYKVYYRSAFDLVEDMADAFRNDMRKKYIQQLTRYDLLIIDEFGMKKMPPNASDDLLEIIHRRYNNTSTIIATNRPLEDWAVILGDNAATSAILDRFLDVAHVFTIKGKSYRMRNKTKK